MAVLMLALMKIQSTSWMKSYFENVPSDLAEHGGRAVARSKAVVRVEGDGAVPDRVVILSFPDAQAAHAFLDDPRYVPYHEQRIGGSTSEILMFENAIEIAEVAPAA